MGHSRREMIAYTKVHAPIFAATDKAIAVDMTVHQFANNALELSDLDERDLRLQLGQFLPELQKLIRKLKSIGVDP